MSSYCHDDATGSRQESPERREYERERKLMGREDHWVWCRTGHYGFKRGVANVKTFLKLLDETDFPNGLLLENQGCAAGMVTRLSCERQRIAGSIPSKGNLSPPQIFRNGSRYLLLRAM